MRLRLAICTLAIGLAYPALGSDDKRPEDGRTEKTENASKDKKDGKEKESPILRMAEMRIDEYVVPARMINLPIPGKTRTVQDLLDRLQKWQEDDKIGAVLLDVSNVALRLADIEELRGGLERLKAADKKVFAYLNAGSPGAYLLACAADEIATAPTGSVIVPGLGAMFPFMKGYYQMVGLEFDVITAGRFKYPGFLNERKPNKYFEEEYGAILDSLFLDYKRFIAQGRNLSPEVTGNVVDTALFDAAHAQQRGLVDVLAYYDEYRDRLLRAEKMKRHRGEDRSLANVNSIQGLMELVNEELRRAADARKAVGPKIAVLHARGPIVDFNLGAAFSSQLICRDDFIKVVEELRKNKSIKAVVLRIDSPGGSGYASDAIWHALRRLDEKKPLVVTMGSVAGSGGYYIACPARKIFAHPTTITGSIGVLGIFQCAQSLFNRMDYEMAPMERGKRSLLGVPHREMRKEDRAFIQQYIDDFYEIFVERVAVTRRMPVSEVKKVAEGRVYTGRDALDLNLVDALGGLDEAIQAARKMANIPPSAELKIVHYPRPSSLGEIFESFSSVGVTQVSDVLLRACAGVRPLTFQQQLTLFSGKPQALCWMAVPSFPRFGSVSELLSRTMNPGRGIPPVELLLGNRP